MIRSKLYLVLFLLGFSDGLSGQTRISISGWKTTEVEEKNMLVMIADFCKENPDVVIDYLPIDEQFQQTIKMKAKSGVVPDIFYVRDLDFLDFYSNGFLLPLDDLLNKHQMKSSEFYPELTNAFSLDGKIYGIPKDFNIIGLVVNETHRKNADLPETSLTDWTEFRTWVKKLFAANLKLNKNPANSGLSLTGNDYELLSFNINHGEFDSRKNQLLLGMGRVKTIVYYLADFQNDESLKSAFNTAKIADDFGNGSTSSIISGIWFFPYLSQKYPDLKYKIYPMPNMQVNLPNRSVMTTVSLGISKYSKNPDVAFRFIKFMINRFDVKEWRKSGLAYPPLVRQLNEIKKIQNDSNGSVNLLSKSGELISLGRWKRSEILTYSDLVRSMLVYKKNPEMITTEIEKSLTK